VTGDYSSLDKFKMQLSKVLRCSAGFKALISKNKFTPATLETLNFTDLPFESVVKRSFGICDTIINVKYSNLSYKDALIVLGKYPGHGLSPPLVPGIDLIGTIEETSSEKFKAGDVVLINGFGLGTEHWGGFSQKACVRHDWLMPLPKTLSELDAARIGTAGYTAMLSVDA